MIIAGIDEAGYGPTLGPLVVSVGVFRIEDPGDGPGTDLWTRLASIVTKEPDGHRIPVNDSKRLFHGKRRLRDLEEGLLPFLALRPGGLPADLRALLARVMLRRRPSTRPGAPAEAPASDAYLEDYPWYRGRNLEIPCDTYATYVRSKSDILREVLASAGIEFLGLAARPMEVEEFNRRVDAAENKALVSFHAVASFLRRLWSRFPSDRTEVVVDRQGGRMRYGPLLFEKLRPRGVRVEAQTPELSVYRLSRRETPRRGVGDPPDFRVSFAVDAETHSMPVALASMLSKYLRELHMILFNRFWREHRDDLKPTAGYAVDARRFLGDIAPIQERLGIDDQILIRKR